MSNPFNTGIDNPFHPAVRLKVLGQSLLMHHPQPPRKVSWLDLLGVFGPYFLFVSVGYRAVAVFVFALWRPQLVILVVVLMGATLVFRVYTLVRIVRAVHRILIWSVGADAIVTSAPKRGTLRVDVNGRDFEALQAYRNPHQPKVGQRVGVLMTADRRQVLMLLG